MTLAQPWQPTLHVTLLTKPCSNLFGQPVPEGDANFVLNSAATLVFDFTLINFDARQRVLLTNIATPIRVLWQSCHPL
jgi:hypothetical protein